MIYVTGGPRELMAQWRAPVTGATAVGFYRVLSLPVVMCTHQPRVAGWRAKKWANINIK